MTPSLLIIRASLSQWPSGLQLYLLPCAMFYLAVAIKAAAVHFFASTALTCSVSTVTTTAITATTKLLSLLPLPSLLPVPLLHRHPYCHCQTSIPAASATLPSLLPVPLPHCHHCCHCHTATLLPLPHCHHCHHYFKCHCHTAITIATVTATMLPRLALPFSPGGYLSLLN